MYMCMLYYTVMNTSHTENPLQCTIYIYMYVLFCVHIHVYSVHVHACTCTMYMYMYMENHVHSTLAINRYKKQTWTANTYSGKHMYSAGMA